jgi:endonuclease/exonuclease/phosphatase family metal-dependent hydrolase
MLRIHHLSCAILLVFLSPLQIWALSVVAYNVENLFDLDGVASYEDYSAAKYTPRHLLVKVGNAAKALSKVDGGRGPDVVILNEIEIDQTPDGSGAKAAEWLDSVKNRTLEEILSESPLPPDTASVPAELWLLKALEEAGLGRYFVVTPDESSGSHEDGRSRSVKNVILSRFPVKTVKTHHTLNARGILEAQLDVEGQPLTIFANHWKSGAGSPDNERVRMANARTLRERLNEIFKQDPLADVIIAGDLNSHYNQTRRYPDFKKSGINDVLGSQGNETALESGEADLYNLWFELPAEKRGSDVYQNEWGTLMHLIVSRGLYDTKGLQYQDNSFEVLAIPGLNADALGRPLRWSRGSKPSGFSDHFPILARFRVSDAKARGPWMPLTKPSVSDSGDAKPVREVSRDEVFSSAIHPAKEPPDTDFRKPQWLGKVFLISAPGKVGKRGAVTVNLNGITYNTFSPDSETRDRLRKMASSGAPLNFYAQLNVFKDEWQFFLPKGDWILEKSDNKK